jgi:DNA helicase-2/ATP-dependent DNA helicase PcrA
MASGFSLSTLNAAQRDAVNALDGPVLILAGAGTGKTRTVTCRIANMVDKGIPPEEILAVTFTNKAASEMRERVGGMVRKKAAAAITVCTFHSLCVRLLRVGIDRLGYKKNFAIFTGQDQEGLMKQLIVRKGGAKEKLDARMVLGMISKAKNAGREPDDQNDDFIGALALAYQNELRAQNAVDFDDLLILAEKLLREHADVRHECQQKYTRITVDEFQDTNGLQMQLLQLLVGPADHVCVVGDDDQSIYGWRGAEVANILQFERFFANPKVIKLQENYRSTLAVLHTANSLIRHNTGRREKSLIATKPGGEPVRIVAMPGDEEEAEFIADEINNEQGLTKRPLEDFAILFRTNGQSRKIEEALRHFKLPYRMVGAQSFFDRREIRDVLGYLQVLATPEADIPLLRILNTPARGISQGTAMLALDWSRENSRSVWETLGDPRFKEPFSTKVCNALDAFVALILTAREAVYERGVNPGGVLRGLLEEIDYVGWLKRGCKTEAEVNQRSEGVHELTEDLAKYAGKGRSLQQFLDDMALSADRDDDDLEKKQGVTLITLHAAKGLEYPIVYLVGLEEGVLPHRRSIEEGTRDEERRLLYVGITRAQERLTMTYCSTRMKWGEKTSCQSSSFIVELDEEHLIHTTYDDVMGAEASPEETENFFAGLRSMLEG